MEKERKECLMEEKYCIICYELIGDSELVEIPRQRSCDHFQDLTGA